MKLIRSIIPHTNDNRPGIAMRPKYITVHETANKKKGANAEMHSRYVKNPTTQASWHITVDDGDVAYQHLPFSEVGWHAGDGRNGTGNRNSIGIEICVNEDGNFEKAVANAQEVIRDLMKQFDIPLKNVVPHKHWSGKNCPTNLLKLWSEFHNGIEGKKVEVKPIIEPSSKEKAELHKSFTSVVDYMKANGMDSSFANRTKLAKQYGIKDYKGTAAHNIQLLELLQNNNKPKPAPKGDMKTNSIVDYLKSIGEDASYVNRKKLATKYGISNYSGTAGQNLQLLKKIRG